MTRLAAPAALSLALAALAQAGEEAPLDALVALLGQHWTVRVGMPEVQEAVGRLGEAKHAAVDRLVTEFNRAEQTFAFRHRAVLALQAIASPKAQQALLDIALGKLPVDTQPSLKAWASQAYLAGLKDKAEARKLLASDVDGVLNNALLALKGQAVDAELLARIRELLKSEVLAIRLAAAAVLRDDPGEGLAAAKVAAILDVIRNVPKRAEGDKVWWPGNFTLAEGEYHGYIQALAEMRGADTPLNEITPKLSGPPRACAVLARAHRGDRTARAGILRLAVDPEAGRMREWAVRALARIGEAGDRKLLETIAATDPLSRERGGCMAPMNQERFFPVRDAAREALKALTPGPPAP
ncbi:MAG: hypothetical protein FJ291_27520 [Planctomycetes bacterium]|nr:hypothetical protein [Planctomycetota bacterium]